MKASFLILITILLTACSGIRSAAELDPDERGAACIHIEGVSVNPFVNGSSRAAILEINTGDPEEVISPQLIAETAKAMGFHP